MQDKLIRLRGQLRRRMQVRFNLVRKTPNIDISKHGRYQHLSQQIRRIEILIEAEEAVQKSVREGDQ